MMRSRDSCTIRAGQGFARISSVKEKFPLHGRANGGIVNGERSWNHARNHGAVESGRRRHRRQHKRDSRCSSYRSVGQIGSGRVSGDDRHGVGSDRRDNLLSMGVNGKRLVVIRPRQSPSPFPAGFRGPVYLFLEAGNPARQTAGPGAAFGLPPDIGKDTPPFSAVAGQGLPHHCFDGSELFVEILHGRRSGSLKNRNGYHTITTAEQNKTSQPPPFPPPLQRSVP